MPDHFHQYIQTRSDGSLYLPMWKAFFSIFINHFPKLDNPRFKGCVVRQIGSKLYPVDNDGNIIFDMGREISHLDKLFSFLIYNSDVYLDPSPNDWEKIVSKSENQLQDWLSEEKKKRMAEEFFRRENAKEIHCIRKAADWNDASIALLKNDPLWLSLWREGEICCLFADSNIGKSIYAVQMACEIAKSKKVLLCDYEMDAFSFVKRYSDANGIFFNFPPNFFRSQPNPELFLAPDIHTAILQDLELKIKNNLFEVIIIDNISYITRNDCSGLAMLELVHRLKLLQRKFRVSFLIIAHTAKRDRRSPISSDDLQGNKRFFDFLDSCFAIGQSFKDKNIQYVKQLKCRVGEFSHAADNVILIRKVKDGAFLHFETIGFDNEEALLPPKYSSNSDWLLEMVLKLRSQNLPERQIAQKLGISKSKVHRLLVSSTDSNSDQPISLAK